MYRSVQRASSLLRASSPLRTAPQLRWEVVRYLSVTPQITDIGIRDGTRELLHQESRHMCRCEECYGKHSTHKGVLNARAGIKITHIGHISEHYMTLTWDDGHVGLIARTDRGAHGPQPIPSILDKYYDLSMRRSSSLELWRGNEKEVDKMFSYAEVIGCDEKVREFVAHFMRYGIARLGGIPREKATLEVVNKELEVGPTRSTMYDDPDVVEFKANASNAAYTTKPLQGHTDLSYYIQNPQIFLFRCLANTTEEGESFWADTFAAMKIVREERPDYFHTLATTPTYYRYAPPGTNRHLCSFGTVVELLGDEIMAVRDQLWTLDEYEMVRRLSLEARAAWWEAYTFYRSKIDPPSCHLTRKMRPGDLAIIDNKRVTHGRRGFSVTAANQERIFDTSYGDWSHFQRRLLDTSSHPPAFLELDAHITSIDAH